MCRVQRVWQWFAIAALAPSACGQQPSAPSTFAVQRQRMVDQQLKSRGIVNERVLAAMKKVPREEFVPPESRTAAYEDSPLPIGYSQTISQPYIVGFMTEQLRLNPADRVL